MTKKEMFAYIKSALADNAEVAEFCDHEIELLSRKVVRKPTKNQIENEGIIAKIVDILSDGSALTVTEIGNALDMGLANQRVSALVRQLKDKGTVVRTEVKGKAYFALAQTE